MLTKAVIFDKDGTLMDFDSFWLPVTRNVIRELKREKKADDILENEILDSLGIENGVTNIDGILCGGTYAQAGKIMHDVLKNHGYDCSVNEVTEFVTDSYYQSFEKGVIKPACDNICEVFGRLKRAGLKLVVVTTDKPFVTKKCLQRLGIEELLDRVYTDDGNFLPKPDPCCIFDFLTREELSTSEVVMVGDTLTDVTFAKNGGIKVIGVAKNDTDRERLTGKADAVIPDISHIFEVLE